MTPTPRMLYVHDDLSEQLAGLDGETRRLGERLLARVARDRRVVMLSAAAQVEAVIARGGHAPFAVTVGIGAAGARVAERLHARTGWFPAIVRAEVWREETEDGGYALAGPAPLAEQLRAVAGAPSVAVVDDTIFSGLTMRAVLAALPAEAGQRRHAFCLRAVAESLAGVAALTPVTAGVMASGRLLDDVSLINAGGLVRRGAIRRAGAPALAFFERPEWMAAWFPDDHAAVTALCRRLSARLSAPPPLASAAPAGRRGDRAPRTARGPRAPSAPPGRRRPGSSSRRSAPGR
jgi:adenine/guanine phosphoribosyltransferase-like PRPP-binding protein